jgi:hypothetical protein
MVLGDWSTAPSQRMAIPSRRLVRIPALVLGLGAVIHSPATPVAAHAAAAQLGVERVEDLAVELAHRRRTCRGPRR